MMGGMSEWPHPINRTLLALHDNQVRRVGRVFEGLREDVFVLEPGADCKSIRQIGEHLLHLHRFMLTLLGSPLGGDVPDGCESVGELRENLKAAGALLRRAIAEHDPDDWFADPPAGREGPWADEPTLARFARPFNDVTNHLGGIRAIRRMQGNPADKAQ